MKSRFGRKADKSKFRILKVSWNLQMLDFPKNGKSEIAILKGVDKTEILVVRENQNTARLGPVEILTMYSLDFEGNRQMRISTFCRNSENPKSEL